MDSEEKPRFKQTEIGLIPQEWETKKLEDVCLKEKGSIISGPFGSNIGSRFFVENGIPVIRGNNLTTDFTKFVDDSFVFVTKEKAKELGTWAEEDDLVFTAAGTLGQVAIIPQSRKHEKYIISNKQLRARLDKRLIIPLFAFYWFKSKKMVEYINSRNTGSTIPLINLSVLRSLPLPYPSMKEQTSIVSILSALDLRIELNLHVNKTLEAIGQAFFRRWFVDFEFPNEEGKPYKSSGGEIVDSTLREIPSGWGTGGLGDICEMIMGQSPPGETYNEANEGVPFFQGIRDFGFRFPSKRVYCTAPTRFAQEGDVLLSVRAPVGSLNIADVHCAIGRGIAALRLKVKQNSFLYYLLLATRSAWDQYDAKGTVFGSATKQDVHDFKIIIPPKDLRDQFGELIEPLDQKILLNEKESRNLTTIRDSLLPRLMSGKIRVPVPGVVELL